MIESGRETHLQSSLVSKIPLQRAPSTKRAFWYFSHYEYYHFNILIFIGKSYKNT